MAKYSKSDIVRGQRTLANGAVAGYVQNDAGKEVWRIVDSGVAKGSAAAKDRMNALRAQKTGTVYGRGMAKGTPRRAVTAKAGARLLRAAHLRAAQGNIKKAQRGMRSDMSRARAFPLVPGTAESIRYRQLTGPLRYDLKGVDAGKASHDARRYKAGVRAPRKRGRAGAATTRAAGRTFATAN